MKQFRNMLMGTAAVGLTAMVVNPVAAAETEKTFKVSGHVNRVAAFIDDGDNTYVDFSDPDGNSVTRFRMVGESKGSDLTIGAVIEFGIRSDRASTISQSNRRNNGNNQGTLDHRRSNVYFKHKTFGTIYLGQNQAVSDGIAEVDVSGTSVAYYNGAEPVTGYRFAVAGTGDGEAGSAGGGPTLGAVHNAYDGLSRRAGASYHSPKFMGFGVQVGTYQGGSSDAVVTYSGTVLDSKIAAEAGGWNTSSVSTSSSGGFGGSVSALHSSGITATFAYTEQDLETQNRDDPSTWNAKVGYSKKLISAGQSSFSLVFGETEDRAALGDELDMWGILAVQKLSAYGTELYAAYTNWDLDRTSSTNYDDIDAGWVGVRVKF